MNEGFSTAFMLLSVGMITVFTILALIVFMGNVLISCVNQYLPEEKNVKAVSHGAFGDIESRKLVAIVSAIDVVSNGNAKVTSITKAD